MTPDRERAQMETTTRPDVPPSGGSWLTALGIAMGALGAGMALLPGIAPQSAWIAQGLAKNGATPGLVLLAGSIVAAVGAATRSLVRQVHAGSSQPTEPPLKGEVEQIISDLAEVRGSLQELRVEYVYVKDGVQELRQRMHEQLAATDAAGMQEGIYRMAGSLDQLGARLEERLGQHHEVMQQSMQMMQGSLMGASARIDEVHARVSTPMPQGATPVALTKTQFASLGVLDELDDLAPIHPQQRVRRTAIREEEGSELPMAPLPTIAPEDLVLASKVSHLQSLLTDARVRQALADMQRTGTV